MIQISEEKILKILETSIANSLKSNRSPVSAVAEINKMLGFYAVDKVVTQGANISKLTPDEIDLFREKFNDEF